MKEYNVCIMQCLFDKMYEIGVDVLTHSFNYQCDIT